MTNQPPWRREAYRYVDENVPCIVDVGRLQKALAWKYKGENKEYPASYMKDALEYLRKRKDWKVSKHGYGYKFEPIFEGEHKDLFSVFSAFVSKYPGTKRSAETEWREVRKHKDYRAVIPILQERLDKIIAAKNKAKQEGEFTPEFPHLRKWLSKRYWEEESGVERKRIKL